MSGWFYYRAFKWGKRLLHNLGVLILLEVIFLIRTNAHILHSYAIIVDVDADIDSRKYHG